MRKTRLSFVLFLALATTAIAAPLPSAPDLLAAYVRVDTSNPPGHTDEAAELWESFFADEGIPTQKIRLGERKPALLARIGSGPAVVLMHHMDVVPAIASEWEAPPFAGEVRDGILYGRGVVDTKSLGVFQALALARLHREKAPLERQLVFLAMPDEEVGAVEGAIPFVENHWAELGDPEVLLNEGAVGTVGVFGEQTPVMAVQVAEKRVLWLKATARGKSGHGSMPHDDIAVATLARALHRIASWETDQRVVPVIAEMLRRTSTLQTFPRSFLLRHADAFWAEGLVTGKMADEPSTNAITRNTCSLTGLEAGMKINTIPETATAMIDCRLLPDVEPEDFLAELREVVDDDRVTFEIELQLAAAPPTPWDTAAFRAIEDGVLASLPGAVLAPTMSGGFTDSTHFRAKGLPSYGFNPLVLDPEEARSLHNRNERAGVANLERADRIYTEVVRRLATGASDQR